ncbi:syntaxin-like t-SNARE protein TLG2 [Mycena albidolilacea]|uniref:Syntaxin-like t-SNARE protein TLG2 n=1 Tax=Mycena albidolilacea TaxID=1033008 RepID=A0AAD6ZZV5_9AGAR|nr:syntaxin-like t-SNARE protein TLG2 [Mycena albidolilacea]
MDVLVRSRTGLFLSYRDSRARLSHPRQYPESPYAAAGDEHEGLIPASPSHTALDLDLPPKWVDISEQVQDILAEAEGKITALEKLHAKHVLPGFTDRSSEEREIEGITTDITKDFRRCQALIQRIGTQPHTFPPSHPDAQSTAHAALAAKNVQRGLAAKVQDLSATFRKKQRVYMESKFRLPMAILFIDIVMGPRELISRTRLYTQSLFTYDLPTELQGHAIKNQDLLIASGTISLKGSEGMSAVDDDVAAATHTQVQSQSLSGPSQDLTQRDRELTEIAKSISQLAELFKDLSVLVIDQGTLLDSVEYNIEQTAFQVEDAVRELKVATGYQKNTGRRQCIFLLLLIIFGLVVVLILKPKRHSSPPPPPSPPDEKRLIYST